MQTLLGILFFVVILFALGGLFLMIGKDKNKKQPSYLPKEDKNDSKSSRS